MNRTRAKHPAAIARMASLILVSLTLVIATGCSSDKRKVGQTCQGNECESGLSCVAGICATISSASDTANDATDASNGSDTPQSQTQCPALNSGHPQVDSKALQLNTKIATTAVALCQCLSKISSAMTYDQCLSTLNVSQRCFTKPGKEICYNDVVNLDPVKAEAWFDCALGIYATIESCISTMTCEPGASSGPSCLSGGTLGAQCDDQLSDAQRSKITECSTN